MTYLNLPSLFLLLLLLLLHILLSSRYHHGGASSSCKCIFLNAAHVGKLKRLKKSAASLDHVLEDGIPAIMENTRDTNSRRAIHFVAAGGSVKVLKYLIEELKLNVDVKDGSRKTPLYRAAIEGRLDVMEYLLQIGANPEIPDDSNISPLHHVAMIGHKEIIPLLLSKGINVDVTNDFGSPIHYAATAGEHDTVKVLLDHGANPNMIFHGTLTPLQASIHSRSWQCVERFLK
ncbi:hypothetical protein MKX03_014990, partial [Papaver bracteatum]